MGRGWDGGTDVSRRRNGSANIGTGTSDPPLALEGRRAVVSGDWHQLSWCRKGARYLCQSRKIIQIEYTKSELTHSTR